MIAGWMKKIGSMLISVENAILGGKNSI